MLPIPYLWQPWINSGHCNLVVPDNMADLPEHKDGGDDGKPDTTVALKEGSFKLQCSSSGVSGEDPHQSKGSTILHSSELHHNE